MVKRAHHIVSSILSYYSFQIIVHVITVNFLKSKCPLLLLKTHLICSVPTLNPNYEQLSQSSICCFVQVKAAL